MSQSEQHLKNVKFNISCSYEPFSCKEIYEYKFYELKYAYEPVYVWDKIPIAKSEINEKYLSYLRSGLCFSVKEIRLYSVEEKENLLEGQIDVYSRVREQTNETLLQKYYPLTYKRRDKIVLKEDDEQDSISFNEDLEIEDISDSELIPEFCKERIQEIRAIKTKLNPNFNKTDMEIFGADDFNEEDEIIVEQYSRTLIHEDVIAMDVSMIQQKQKEFKKDVMGHSSVVLSRFSRKKEAWRYIDLTPITLYNYFRIYYLMLCQKERNVYLETELTKFKKKNLSRLIELKKHVRPFILSINCCNKLELSHIPKFSTISFSLTMNMFGRETEVEWYEVPNSNLPDYFYRYEEKKFLTGPKLPNGRHKHLDVVIHKLQ